MCEHDNKKPYYYGYMARNVIEEVNEQNMYYGGLRAELDSPTYFCLDCLEDLFD